MVTALPPLPPLLGAISQSSASAVSYPRPLTPFPALKARMFGTTRLLTLPHSDANRDGRERVSYQMPTTPHKRRAVFFEEVCFLEGDGGSDTEELTGFLKDAGGSVTSNASAFLKQHTMSLQRSCFSAKHSLPRTLQPISGPQHSRLFVDSGAFISSGAFRPIARLSSPPLWPSSAPALPQVSFDEQDSCSRTQPSSPRSD